MTSEASTRSTVVIVSGLPATGKTTLARELADALNWPVFSRDHFKELLFESRVNPGVEVGRGAARDFGKQAMYLLYAIARELTQHGTSCIIEANFHPELAGPELEPLASSTRVVQVHCVADDAVIVARYRARFEAGERHPVHFDARMVGDLQQRINTNHRHAIPLDAELIEVSSENGFVPDLATIVQLICECRNVVDRS